MLVGPEDGKLIDLGGLGVQIGDEVLYATVGDLVFKPRGIWHGFWNRGDEPARVLALISPGGFEHYFDELPPLLQPEPDFEGLAELQARYGLSMDMDTVATISEREGLGP